MYQLQAREIPFNNDFEVIVIGGGPSGCAAAAAAAREGRKTLLIEATGVLGGMATSALVPCFAPYSDGTQVLFRGFAQTVLEKMRGGINRYTDKDYSWISIDAEALKRIYDDLVTGYGAEVLFHTSLADVDMDGQGRVRAVIVNNSAGLSAYQASVYVDCTGDAVLAARAGAEYEKGSDEGDLMPATHCFTIAHVDENAYQYDHRWGWLRGTMHPMNPRSFVHEMAESDEFPLMEDNFLGDNQVGPGTIGFNAGHLWQVDSTDPHSISVAMIKGRKLAYEIQRGLIRYFPEAFGNSYLIATGNMMGIRESRRVIGDYVLTVEDYVARRVFEDEIGRSCFEMDVHVPKDPERAARLRQAIEQKGVRYQPGDSFGIPYRCLTPKSLRNVLVAGRAISCERLVMGSVRIMPVCLVTGEAAGVAAARAVDLPDNDTHAVDTVELRSRLKACNAYFL